MHPPCICTFCSLLEGDSQDCMLSFSHTRASQMLRALQLFSLEQCHEMLICELSPNSAIIWKGFHWPPRWAFTRSWPHGGCRGQDRRLKCTQHGGGHGPVRWTVGGASQVAYGRLPEGVCEAFLSPSCYDPSLSQPFSYTNHLSVLGGAEEKWISWTASHTAEEVGCSLTHCPFPPWEKCRWGRFLWHCATSEERWWRFKGKLFFSPSSLHPILETFALTVCWNFSTRPLDSVKSAFIHGTLSKPVFCGVPEENSYSTILLTSLSLDFTLNFMILKYFVSLIRDGSVCL